VAQGGGVLPENYKQLQEKLDVCEKDKKKFAEAEHKAKRELSRVNTEATSLRDEMARLTREINQLHYQVRRGCGLIVVRMGL